jgi:hypothetical protein
MRLTDRIRRWFKPEPPIQLVAADWFTDEHPIVAQDVEAWHWEPVLEHEHPIGPAPATAAEMFAADPLGAPLHEVPRVNPFYADVLNGQSTWMSEQTRTDLESVTGYWTADFMKELIEKGRSR